MEGLQDEAQQPELHVIKGKKPTEMKWFSLRVNSSHSCWWLFQLAARLHKAAFHGLCFNNVLLYQLIMPLWPMKEECSTFPPQHYLFFCEKGAVGFACAVTCSFKKLRVFNTIIKKRLCVGLFWITLKPVFCQWYLCGIFNGLASLREVVGSGSSRELLLAFLSSAFYLSRNNCSSALAQDPCQRPEGWSVLYNRALSYVCPQSVLKTARFGSGM